MQASSPMSSQLSSMPWYKHRWPWLLMLGPGIVVLAGIVTIWLAFTHQDALVTGDYYKEGKAINQDLRRDRAAEALQLDADLRFLPADGRLAGRITSAGNPYPGKVLISMHHSTLPEKDLRLEVTADADGRFEASLPLLDMARWQVTLENPGRDWRLAGRWLWPQQQSLRIMAETPVLQQ